VGLKSLKSLNLTNGYPNKNNNNKNNNNNNNKVKSKPLELFELAGKKFIEASRNWQSCSALGPNHLDNNNNNTMGLIIWTLLSRILVVASRSE
jgi:hypothetical protein